MATAGTQRPILEPLPDGLIDDLVCMALARKRDEPPQVAIRELVRLVEAELQGQIDEAWTRRS